MEWGVGGTTGEPDWLRAVDCLRGAVVFVIGAKRWEQCVGMNR